jgi:MFS family permease
VTRPLGERLTRLTVPLRDPSTRPVLLSFGISEIGDGISAVVIPLAIFSLTESVMVLGLAYLARLLIGSILAALGGAAADRYDRHVLLLYSFFGRSALVGSLALVWSNTPVFVVLGTLAGAFGSFDNPAAESLLRSRLPGGADVMASVRAISRTLSSIAGPGIGALLIGTAGTRAALLVDLASFILAGAILLGTYSRGGAVVRSVATSTEARIRPVPSAFRFVSSSTIIAPTFASSFVGGVAVATVTLLAIPYLNGIDSAPEGSYGWSLSLYAVGALIGVSAAGVVHWHIQVVRLLTRVNVIYGAVCLASVALQSWWLLAIMWLLWGVAYGPEQVVCDTRLVDDTPNELLGRVYGLWSTVTKIAAGLGYMCGAWVAADQTRTAIAVVGLIYIVIGPLAVWGSVRFASARFPDGQVTDGHRSASHEIC